MGSRGASIFVRGRGVVVFVLGCILATCGRSGLSVEASYPVACSDRLRCSMEHQAMR